MGQNIGISCVCIFYVEYVWHDKKNDPYIKCGQLCEMNVMLHVFGRGCDFS